VPLSSAKLQQHLLVGIMRDILYFLYNNLVQTSHLSTIMFVLLR
jgi:hypothetical protein